MVILVVMSFYPRPTPRRSPNDTDMLQIKKGSHVSIPLWLGGFLGLQKVGPSTFVKLELPASLAPRVLNALKADARTVDLRALAPHFYELAARVLELEEDEDVIEELSDVLSEVGYSPRSTAYNRSSRMTLSTL